MAVFTTRPARVNLASKASIRSFGARNAKVVVTRAMQRKDERPPLKTDRPTFQATETFAASLALWALTELPALAAAEAPFGAPPAQSYYVSLGLFVMTVPGKFFYFIF